MHNVCVLHCRTVRLHFGFLLPDIVHNNEFFVSMHDFVEKLQVCRCQILCSLFGFFNAGSLLHSVHTFWVLGCRIVRAFACALVAHATGVGELYGAHTL